MTILDDAMKAMVAQPKARKIETQYVNPPIPINNFDWQATYEGYDEGDPVGHGATEQAAIEDLIEKTEGKV